MSRFRIAFFSIILLLFFICPDSILKSQPADDESTSSRGSAVTEIETLEKEKAVDIPGTGMKSDPAGEGAIEGAGDDIGTSTVNPEFIRLKENRLRVLQKAAPGAVSYFSGDLPPDQIIGIAVTEIDGDGTRGLVLLTTGSMEVFQFSWGGKIERLWEGKFTNRFPSRGTAASVFSSLHQAKKIVFVSVNKFSKSLAYRWENGRIVKAGRANGSFVDAIASKGINLLSEYGNGIISFSGKDTHFINTSGEKPEKSGFPIDVDYFSGCILRWMDESVELARVAVVTEEGKINVYQGPGKPDAVSAGVYGGELACAGTKQNEYLLTTTNSETDDAIVLLEVKNDSISEIWRSSQLGGAVTNLATGDFDGDGRLEVIGALRKTEGLYAIFRLLPGYPEKQ